MSKLTPTSTDIKSIFETFFFIVVCIPLSASSSICGFMARNTISQLSTTSPFFNVAWAPKSAQNPKVLSVRAETQTLSGFKIPTIKNLLH